MTSLEDFADLKSRINQEGFHYCFKHYSNFEEIRDEKLHILREQYLKAADELEKYINDKAQDFFMGVDEDFDDEGF